MPAPSAIVVSTNSAKKCMKPGLIFRKSLLFVGGCPCFACYRFSDVLLVFANLSSLMVQRCLEKSPVAFWVVFLAL